MIFSASAVPGRRNIDSHPYMYVCMYVCMYHVGLKQQIYLGIRFRFWVFEFLGFRV